VLNGYLFVPRVNLGSWLLSETNMRVLYCKCCSFKKNKTVNTFSYSTVKAEVQ
jgi:hypothetical protein